MRIGIPQTLTYFSYFPFWKTFFHELDFEVLISSPTTKKTLDLGTVYTVTDACVPIKLYHGHVAVLADQADAIFVPRFVCMDGKSTFCPKFLGLPDMLRASMDSLPRLIDPRIDLRKGRRELYRAFKDVAASLSCGWLRSVKAYRKAVKVQSAYESLLHEGLLPDEAMSALDLDVVPSSEDHGDSITLALLGYPYAIFDSYVNCGIIDKLKSMGVRILTTEALSDKCLFTYESWLEKNPFWHYSNRALRAGLHYMSNKMIDGLIHVTAFGCGPDAIVDKLLELEAKNSYNLPFLSITIDEHSGEAGTATRVEAFVDMISRKQRMCAS